MHPVADIGAERAVLAGICQYGQSSYLDVADIINKNTFTVEHAQHIYECIDRLCKSDIEVIDAASIMSAADELGLTNVIGSKSCAKYLSSLFNFHISERNVRKLAAKIGKLQIARDLRDQMHDVGDKLLGINGDESLASILGIAETAIFDFSSRINNSDEEPRRISDGIVEYIQYLGDNPVDQLGISTGFPNYDRAIGGGLRPGSVNVIGARIKVGKSLIGSNMGYYIADSLGIPVLNMDTEMTYEDHLHRMLAMGSECYIHDIETGKFIQKPGQEAKLKRLGQYLEQKKVPYFHKSIAGMPFEEQLAILRRWIMKEVGLDNDGKAKPCVIVYDYLKLMTSESINGALQEYQLLGFMMTSLHNFAVRYKIPILMFIQLNRDGITKESTDVASGSDRVMWLCSNFTLFKWKSDEEIAKDGPEAGNRKLVPLIARHGGGLGSGDYINCYFNGAIAKIKEGEVASEYKPEKTEKPQYKKKKADEETE